ncbi:MAG: protein-disulfide reductase DsbD family protein [Rubricoccaceae bacterium]
MVRPRLACAFLLSVLALPLGIRPLAAQTLGTEGSPHSRASLVAPQASVAPGSTLDVGLRIELDPHWHTYWINPGDSGLPVRIAWELPPGVEAGPLRFPAPERLDVAGLVSYAFEDEVVLLAEIRVPSAFAAEALELRGQATWLVCEDVCLPAEATVSLTLPVRAGPPVPDAAGAALVARARARLPAAVPGWQARAETTDLGYRLRLTPPAGWSGTLEGGQFFVAEGAVLNYAPPQLFVRDGADFVLDLQRSDFAQGTPEALEGVLVGPPGTTFDADGAVVALALEAPVAGARLGASGDAAAGPAPLGLALALVLALGGGLLLNLMPCVFPILSIKLLGFAQGRGTTRAAMRAQGGAFGAGVLVSFWVLAGLLIALRAAGMGLGWGFQLQSPWLVAALALLMVVLALNLLGVFEVGGRLASVAGQMDRRSGTSGAFLSGVLAVIVATPCTAPFMGAALGFALAQPAAVALLVFTALGVGMALPYVLLALFPQWIERLPAPGPWMETLRQALAFPLLATAVWLVWVFGRQTGVDGAALLLLAIVALAVAAWLVGRWPRYRTAGGVLVATRAIALAMLGAAALATLVATQQQPPVPDTAAAGDGWEAFSPERLEALVAEGRPVFIDFTAAWCLTCQVNKRTTLGTARVEEAFAEAGVVRVRADWTNRDPAISAILDAHGRSGVPFYLFYPGGGRPPLVLPEVLTPQAVLEAVGQVPGAVARR